LWINNQYKENDIPVFTLAVPQQSDAKGELINDGLMIDYYFENGKFRGEKQIL